ncbi:MAG: aminoacyl-tRNA hydrolase [Minisyncoccales bacterium]
MILIIGLGNPEKKFEKTRHNLGFLALNELAKQNNFSPWQKNPKANCLYAKKTNGQEIELVKPLTHMNNSGKSVKYLVQKHKLKTENLIVVHDDIDLTLGKIKIVKNRGSAGHKGVESIIKELKTKNFIRIRIGIQPITGKPNQPENFVLQNFSPAEEKIVKETIKKTIEAIVLILKNGWQKTQNIFN